MILIKKLLKEEKGSAIIEVSIALPILLGLFMGLVFYTNAMRYKLVIDMAAKEGARTYQVTHGNISKAKTRAYEELTLGNVGGASVETIPNGVRITKPYGFYIPMFGRYLLDLKSEHQFHKELDHRYYKTSW